MDVAKIIARSHANRGVAVSPSDEMLVIGDLIAEGFAELQRGMTVSAQTAFDEAALRRVVREAVGDVLPADLPKMLQQALVVALRDHQTKEGEKILDEIARHHRWSIENRWPKAITDAGMAAIAAESEHVEPTWPEAFGIAFRRIGSWFGLCQRPEWR